MQKNKKYSPNFCVKVNQKLKQENIEIKNIQSCYFPYEPYAQQINVINCVNKTIKNSLNALIQSPTGTGKTLCLLTGALSALAQMGNKNVKIFYLTRTHYQISQVIEEFKKTCYSARVNIIASRDHFCINPNLKEMKSKALEKACNDMVCNKTCLYKQADKKFRRVPYAMKLQQFKQDCKKQLICPFFYSKQLTDKTEISILPFNYFLDWKIFQSYSDLIKNSIIIFDEAHNVDIIAEEGSNLQISTTIIKFALLQIKNLKKKCKSQNQSNQKARNDIKISESILQRLNDSIQSKQSAVFCSKHQIQEFIIKSTTIIDPEDSGQTIEGLEINNSQLFFQKLNQVIKLFYKYQVNASNFMNIISSLQKLCRLFGNINFQKNFITKIVEGQNKKYWCLKVKCLSPSVGFQKIKQYGPRSIILSSGTLGDLNKWQKYLNIQFDQKLSISGFITKNQLFASIVPTSQSNYSFQFTYQRKQNQMQHKQLVQQISLIQSRIPNNSGIIIAFSTYSLMEKILHTSQHYPKLNLPIFYQSKGSDINNTFKQYSQKVKNGGAYLFIVMKGRFSEGINFTAQLCRCLVVVGIPFLPINQLNVKDKMAYLRDNFSQDQADTWYMNQTFQVVNQTIGRVIRNKKDFGAIFLLDKRYAKQQSINLLSGWFRNCLKKDISRNQLYQQVNTFFKTQSWLKTQDDIPDPNLSHQNNKKKDKSKKHKKKHLKLKLDSSEQKKSLIDLLLSSNQKQSNLKITKKNNDKKTTRQDSQLKSNKSNTKSNLKVKKNANSNPFIIEKINLDKKQKLKGFTGKKLKQINLKSISKQKCKPMKQYIYETPRCKVGLQSKEKWLQDLQTAQKNINSSSIGKNDKQDILINKKPHKQRNNQINSTSIFLDYFLFE